MGWCSASNPEGVASTHEKACTPSEVGIFARLRSSCLATLSFGSEALRETLRCSAASS